MSGHRDVRWDVYEVVYVAVFDAVDKTVRGAECEAVYGPVYGAVDEAVGWSVDKAVVGDARSPLSEIVRPVVGEPIRSETLDLLRSMGHRGPA
mgnify:CR=1 FL=1